MTSQDAIVEFKGVSKSFSDRRVLDGISCTIEPGRTTVLMGPSGAGKTVFLRLLVGLLQPDSGQILVQGQDIAHMNQRQLREVRKGMGMLFQHAALFDSMSVADNVAFPLVRHTQMSPAERAERVARCLELVDLPGIQDRMPAELSGGMRKRVGLARAIALDPALVLLDEPNSGLDPITASQIDDLILSTQERLGSTFVIISHDIPGAFRVGHRIKLLYQGQLVIRGSPSEVLQSQHPVVRSFLARDTRPLETT